MANVETMGLGPQKSMFVLVIIVGCFAVLWPRILSPMFVGPVKDGLSPNSYDKEAGCCDVISDTDVNAIKIMAEVCNNILRSQSGKIDSKMEQALASGKLTAEIISTCRAEVNKTCGVDIALFLDHNIRLGKTYRQILDDVRSYNSSNCLKMNYGVAPWSLGVPHLVGKYSFKTMSVRQERPPHLQHPPLHPALRERGRAIVNPVNVPRAPRAPSQGPPLPGRVWPSQLHPYLSNYSAQPMPVRPPMGGAGGVVPPPKSSVGFLMPLYTLCIVVFFFYTVFKMVFSKGNADVSPVHQPRYIERPDSKFSQSVFKNTSRRDRNSPETKLVVNAISGLVAEVRQQMEETPQYRSDALHTQEVPPPYTNGSVHHNKQEESPLLSKGQERLLREPTPPSWEDSTPVDREESLLAKEFTILKEEPTPTKESDKENVPPQEQESKPEEYESEVALKEAALLKEVPLKETCLERDLLAAAADLEYEPEYPEKIGEVVEEKLIEEAAIRQLRSSVEKENASFKVLGMEMRAHCEGGAPWSKRSTTPPAGRITPPPSMHSHTRQPTPPVEVSSIYLEGALPHQSRLLVADSQTHTEKLTNGDDKDPPIVLSGKMTLSLINDESAKTTPERDNAVKDDIPSVKDDLPYDDDEEFLTASAATSPKQDEAEYEDGSEEEIDEDQIDEDMEVRNMLEDQPAQNDFLQGERVQRSTNLQGEETIQDVVASVDENHEPTKTEEVLPTNLEDLVAAVEEEEHIPTNIEEDVVVSVDDLYEATKIEEVLATDVDDFEAAFDKLAAALEEDVMTDVYEYQTVTVEEDKPTFLQGESVSSISLQGEEAIQDVVAPVDEHHEATKIEEVLASNVDDFVTAVDKLAAAIEEEKHVAKNIEEDVVADVDEYETTTVEEDQPTQDVFLQGERVGPISLQGEETIQDVVLLVDEQLEATKTEEVLATNVDKLVSAVEVEKHVATNIEEAVVAEVDEFETITVEDDQPAKNDFLQGERVSPISHQGEETIQDVVALVDEQLEATQIEEVLSTKLVSAVEVEKHVATNIEEDISAEVDECETITVEEDQLPQNDFLQGERVSSISLQGEEAIQDIVAPVDEHHEATKIEEVLTSNVDDFVAAVDKLAAAIKEEKYVAKNIEDVVADIDDYETTTVEEDQPTQNDFLQGERVQLNAISLQGEENIQDVEALVDEQFEATKVEEVLNTNIDELEAAVEVEKHVTTNIEEDVAAEVDEYQTTTVEEDQSAKNEFPQGERVSSVSLQGEETIQDVVAPIDEYHEATKIEEVLAKIFDDSVAAVEKLTAAKKEEGRVAMNVEEDVVADVDEYQTATVEEDIPQYIEYIVATSVSHDLTGNAINAADSYSANVAAIALEKIEGEDTTHFEDDIVTKVTEAPYVEVLESTNLEDLVSAIINDEFALDGDNEVLTNVSNDEVANIEYDDELEPAFVEDLEETGVEYEVVVSAADDVTSNAEICETSSVYDVLTSLEDASTDGAGDNVTSNIEDYKSTILEDEVAPKVVDDEATNVEGKKLKNVEIQNVSDLEIDLLKNLEEDVPSNVVEERESAKVETVNIVEENSSDEEEEYEEEIIEEEVEEEEEIEEVEEEEEIEEIEEEEEEIEEPAVNKGTTAVKKA